MRRPKPQRLTQRERNQRNEMDRQKRLFTALELYPNDRFCARCQAREPWEDICPDCRADVERTCLP